MAVSRAQAFATATTKSEWPTGMCLNFVRTMLQVPAKYRTAAIAWSNTSQRRRGTPPPGYPVWWTGGSRGFGHVAVSAGNGYVISTDYPSKGRVGRVAISSITRNWGQSYQGWSVDINGVRLAEPSYRPPAFPTGIGPNKSNPSAVPLQKALKKAGFMPKTVTEHPNYGSQTQAAVARFHNKYTQFRSPGLSNDVAIGPKGWAFLFNLAYGQRPGT